MELKLDKRYALSASPGQAWALLADLRATAACMPGAEITEQLDATHYRGQVRAKVGPAQLSFAGEIELLGLDAAAQSLAFKAKGADKAGSAASMELQAHIAPEGAGSALVGRATVKVSGKLAQIGNRLLLPASEALLAQFAANFDAAALAKTLAKTQSRELPAAKPLNALALLLATLKAWFKRR
jgi:uncharacterized protein